MNCKQSTLRDAVLIALAVGTAGTTGIAFADEGDSQATTLDRLEVTGSRIKRADVEAALPIVTIDRAAIQASGDVSVADFLRDSNFNSFGSYQTTSGSSGAGASTISLRGLGAGRTLILVDGRRAPTAPMLGQGQDLNSIPMAAVERIEILSAGASAIYGSDALGGVINVITRRDFEGMELTIGAGRPTMAGGDTEEMSVVIGSAGERGRVLAGASHTERDVLFTRDRDYWMATKGSSVYSNNFSLNSTTAAAQRLTHPLYGTAVPGDCTNGTNLFYQAANGTCQYDHKQVSANLSALSNDSVFVRGDYQINDDWQAYFVSDVTRVQAFGRYAPVPSSPWPGGAIVLKAGTPNHPGTSAANGGLNPYSGDAYYAGLANQDVYLFHRFAALGPRDSTTTNTTNNYNLGFQGTVGNVDLDFGMRYVKSSALDLGRNYVVAGLAQAAIDSGEYNIYDPTATPDDIKKSIINTISRDMKTSSKEVYANASFDLFEMAGGTAGMAVGAEYREEFYQDIYDPLSEAGQIVGSAGSSASGGRNVKAAYFEALFPFFTGFELNIAGRYDKYNDYGSDFSPMASIRWQPLETLTFRASYGEGFRAPTLDILTMKPSFSATSTSDPQTCLMLTGSTNCNTQASTYSIANPNLSSETSEQWGAGIVWDATDWLNVSLDYYDITINDQIASISLSTVVNCLRGGGSLCPTGLTQFPTGTVLPNPNLGLGAEFDPVTGGIVSAQTGYANRGYIETNGWDFALNANFDLNTWGNLRSALKVTYVDNYSANGGANSAGEPFTPQMRASLSTQWSRNDWTFTWNLTHIDGTQSYNGYYVEYFDTDYGQKNTLPSYTSHDVQLSYNAPWNATITAGVRNVGNKQPIWDPVYGDTDSYLYDFWGRVPYIRYTQRF